MVLPGRIFGRILILLTSAFTLLGATAALAFNISGTVVNNTGKSGRIYITALQGDQGPGVSISSAGSFTITGVPSGNYTLQAFVDTQGNGVRHANDPAGSLPVSVSSSDVTGQSITVTTPATVNAVAPQIIVYRGNGGNFVMWDGAKDSNGRPIADKYRVSWSASNGGAVIGTKDIPSGDNNFFAHSGGLSTYWYKVEAIVGVTSAASGWTSVTTTSGVTVTGTVNLTGITATGPLLVALADQSGNIPVFCTALIPSPSGSQSYTINNVPTGVTYQIYVVLDMNNDGVLDYGDIEQANADRAAPSITVTTNNQVASSITLAAANAQAAITTNHGVVEGGSSWLNLSLILKGMQKQPVNVTVNGPGISATTLGLSNWGEFNWWLTPSGSVNVGDTYAFTTYYVDGSQETINAQISAIIDSYPTPVSPVGLVPYSGNDKPTFTWTAPVAPPTAYSYQISLNGPNLNWNPSSDSQIPSGNTSVVYNYDNTASQSSLVDGNTYYWTISVVDANGNMGGYQTQFTPTSQPAISAFSPASSDVGGTVTIHGINFDPVAANNSVTFGNSVSVTASSVSPDGTILTAVVPNTGNGNLTVTVVGKSPVTSSQPFYIGSTVSFTGKVLDSGNAPVAGATITMENYPLETTTSAADGTFTLTGLPGNNTPFRLIIAKSGYLPVYTDTLYTFTASFDYSSMPYYLYTGSELGLGSGKSAVFARVLNSLDFSPVSGVTATASSSYHPSSPYTVGYLNSATGSFTGTATDASGILRVLNLDGGDFVTLAASKSGWSFSTPSFNAPGDAVVELGIIGSPPPSPSVSTLSPTKAKVGSQVTIFGGNFGATPADNVVKFNGVTASIISVTSQSQILVTVPQGATTGPVTVTTIGGTATSADTFTLQNTLSVTVAGTGGGSVNSITNGLSFSCASGTCSSDFDSGASLTLSATPGSGSLFTGWSGACTGTGNCSVTLNGNQTATATFDIIPNVQMGSVYYGTLLDAYNAAVTGAIIKSQAITFPAFDLNRDIAVTLAGGYDTSINSVTGYTTISGLTISLGSATIDKIAVQ